MGSGSVGTLQAEQQTRMLAVAEKGACLRPVSRRAFHAVHRTRAPEEIIRQIRDLIATGQLTPGNRLPSERDLAQALKVGRSTVREALRSMESLGFVEERAGEGAYLMSPAAPRLPDPLMARLFQTRSIQRMLFEVRSALEPELAALCARRATSEQIARMREALAKQEAGIRRAETGLSADAALHALIADYAGNEILSRIMQSLMDLLRQTREESLRHEGRAAHSLRQHQAIVRAIEGRNPATAARRMREHIRAVECLIFSTREGSAGIPPDTRPGGQQRVPAGAGW
jgi:GntR family transcriptional regulator, transcriptional repressor for pyruvate dehydrogenase complex